MAYNNPSVADFQARFIRDFPYTNNVNTGVLDSDIALAFVQVNVNINPGLFADQGSYTEGYLLLSAHYLVSNIRSSSQGLNGQYNWIEQSKGVGSVNQAFAIPQFILDNPYLSMLTSTNYGSLFIQLLLPQLIGQMWGSWAPTKP